MSAHLNIPAVQAAMKQNGLSGRKLAEQLGVSPQTVANWLSSAAFPHPAQLLKLALKLRLAFEELATQNAPGPEEPRVAARAKSNRVLSDATLAELKGMGKLLEHVAAFLPFDTLEAPPRLATPVVEASYLQRVAQKIRTEIGRDAEEPIGFEDLVDKFSSHNAVLIPVLWGKKDGHENAVHVFLPKSCTTWVYVNLDAYTPDFKFWMAHELGHVYSPTLSGAEAEKFADAFAGALLFPHTIACKAHAALQAKRTPAAMLKVLDAYAKDYGISLYSVYKEASGYASVNQLHPIKIPEGLLRSDRQIANEADGTLAERLWDNKAPEPKAYMMTATKVFKTGFFDALGKCVRDKNRPASFIQSLLDVPLLDAMALHFELAQ